MSKDSSPTYIHMHHPRLADYFEDFTRPHSSLYSNLAAAAAQQPQHHHPPPQQHNGSGSATAAAVTYGSAASPATMVPSFLPIEDIYVPPQYQPLNPEDEDDIVPDQHAAFGITRAMDAATATRREPVWRDFGLHELVRGARVGGGSTHGPHGGGALHGHGLTAGFLPAAALSGSSAVAAGWRLKQAGALMGGRRTRCLR
ncbi:hypothetical protein VTN96DRAFT_6245 [Rasamsonia emersonii]|uniref:Apc13 domain protein n=1 Tax=Rasamsonia emersonii (strain ATCC 16479 / CBS 393.64 / IMI 116815) TaxID=1408163 RepID=A0A0F4YXG4_RASE3|nr:Apc13 domain protein [Rasamsonia emersonii CBS 393.64]KKA22770.1 Apc13 domain protein [Rasamsonia emersonii CBS 393.64]